MKQHTILSERIEVFYPEPSEPFYVSAVYGIRLDGRPTWVEIDSKTFICKIHNVWTDEQKQLIAKNVIPKFKRYVTNLKKYFEEK
jgi:hypothetical protein